MKFFSKDALCEQGREFLADRGLSIKVAQELGVASANGEIAFPFVSNGQIVRIKYRNMQDKKKMRMSSISESEKDKFKLPFWNAQIWPTSEYLILTEGELDTIALSQLGANMVASLPNGASSVQSSFRNHYEYLNQFDLIYLAFDMDAAGEKAVEEAKKLLPPKKFRRIVLPAKDANDWILEDPTLELADLEKLMRNATKLCADQIVHFRDLPDSFYEAREKGFPTKFKEIDRLLGGVRSKELTVISGDTGVGKTTFGLNLLCNLISKDYGVWINSWEMDYEHVVRKVAGVILQSRFKVEAFSSKQRAAFQKWIEEHNVMINPMRSKADIPTLRKQIEMASKLYGVKCVLLDHLDFISDTSSRLKDHERIQEAVSSLHEIAMECDVHIFLISHVNASVERSGKAHMGQLKGSSAIKQYADNILMLHNPHQEDLSMKADNRMIVTLCKNRFFGAKGEVTLRYLAESDSYVDNSQILQGVNHG